MRLRKLLLFLSIPLLATAQQQTQGVLGTAIVAPNGVAAPFPAGSFNTANGPLRNLSNDCSADGTVVNSISGEPVPRARVNFANGVAVTADAAGRFQATGILCGPLFVTAAKAGFLPEFL